VVAATIDAGDNHPAVLIVVRHGVLVDVIIVAFQAGAPKGAE